MRSLCKIARKVHTELPTTASNKIRESRVFPHAEFRITFLWLVSDFTRDVTAVLAAIACPNTCNLHMFSPAKAGNFTKFRRGLSKKHSTRSEEYFGEKNSKKTAWIFFQTSSDNFSDILLIRIFRAKKIGWCYQSCFLRDQRNVQGILFF